MRLRLIGTMGGQENLYVGSFTLQFRFLEFSSLEDSDANSFASKTDISPLSALGTGASLVLCSSLQNNEKR